MIHAASMSPHMGEAKDLMQTNALGTIYMNTEFAKVMGEGGCILEVSSMSACLTPSFVMPRKLYKYALEDAKLFREKMNKRLRIFPGFVRPGVAYGVSPNFIIRYSEQSALRYGDQGIRVVCVSLGNFETPMGKLEEGEADRFTGHAAIKKFGKTEEIAYLFSAIADERNGYLIGLDIICD